MNEKIKTIISIIGLALFFVVFYYSGTKGDTRTDSTNNSIAVEVSDEVRTIKPDASLQSTSTPTPTPNPTLLFNETQEITSRGTPIITDDSDIDALFDVLEIVDVYDSTCFSAIGYSYSDEIFYCQFLEGGSEYIYLNVPPYVYDEIMSADSKGGYYNRKIKPYYDCMKLK